ncbi:MAG TPA: GNAT family N-acetyltransferase [Candidatus Sphingobacterium stercorigallinarum]|nr:GNAT family N-acetyltransferase [Candidatus Sphingobacterium stercorigallinarum]
MMCTREPLNSTRLDLVPLEKEDYESLYLAANDPEIWAQHPDPLRYTPYGFTKYFRTLLGTDLPYVIVDKATQRVIGASAFYQYDEAKKTVTIGYTFLNKNYWGGSYNKELKSLMLNHAFKYVDRVFFYVGMDNQRSKKALEKIRAVQEAETTEASAAGKLLYSLSKTDFLSA